MIRRVAYADGAAYRSPRGMGVRGVCVPIGAMGLDLPRIRDWPGLWRLVRMQLAQVGFRTGTLLVYRQVLRSFRVFAAGRTGGGNPAPEQAARHLLAFIMDLANRETSASWLSLNISILRTVFDKLGGHAITRHLRSPRKPIRLPEILADSELTRLVAAAPTPRDRLLIGFLYGCGLKVGEACNLCWNDLDPVAGLVYVEHATPELGRTVLMPADLRPLLQKGKSICAPGDPVFPGGRRNARLSPRTVERMLRRAAEAARLTKIVTCMTLRHSHAVHRLRAGEDIRSVQKDLGHLHVETTMAYRAFIHSEATIQAINRLTAGIHIAPPCPAESSSGDLNSRPSPGGVQQPGTPSAHGVSAVAECLPPCSMQFDLPPANVIFPLAERTFDLRAFLSGLKVRLTSRFLALRDRAGP